MMFDLFAADMAGFLNHQQYVACKLVLETGIKKRHDWQGFQDLDPLFHELGGSSHLVRSY